MSFCTEKSTQSLRKQNVGSRGKRGMVEDGSVLDVRAGVSSVGRRGEEKEISLQLREQKARGE